MTVKKKAAKKKSAPRMKTAVCTENDSYEVFEGDVDCPYCKSPQVVESRDTPPTSTKCSDCGKTFKIKWDDWGLG